MIEQTVEQLVPSRDSPGVPDAGRLARDDLPPPPAACALTEQTAAQAGEGAVELERQIGSRRVAQRAVRRLRSCPGMGDAAGSEGPATSHRRARCNRRILAAQGEGGEAAQSSSWTRPTTSSSCSPSGQRSGGRGTYPTCEALPCDLLLPVRHGSTFQLVGSRYVVGWTLQHRESGPLAEQLIDQALLQQRIGPDQLTITLTAGSSMTSKPVAFLLADLGPTNATHSSAPTPRRTIPTPRPTSGRSSTDPGGPARFESIEHARLFCRGSSTGTTDQHRHSGSAGPDDSGDGAGRTRPADPRPACRRPRSGTRYLGPGLSASTTTHPARLGDPHRRLGPKQEEGSAPQRWRSSR